MCTEKVSLWSITTPRSLTVFVAGILILSISKHMLRDKTIDQTVNIVVKLTKKKEWKFNHVAVPQNVISKENEKLINISIRNKIGI